MAKKSILEKLRQRREELKKSGGDYPFYLIPEGTMRVRVAPFEDETGDFAYEAVTFFLGKDLGTVVSAETFGESCPLIEAYRELKASKDSDDNKLAEKIKPKKGYFIPVIKFKDESGKETEDGEVKLLKAPNNVYGQMIDYFLEPEQGDFTDPLEGYDFKIKRTGKGMQDTEYTVIACKPTKIADKKLRAKVSAEDMVRALILDYDSAKDKLDKFLKLGSDDEDEKPKKKKPKSSDMDLPVRKKKKVSRG